MRTIKLTFAQLGAGGTIVIGREREQGATRVEIDCRAELLQYPGAGAAITLRPPGGAAADDYPAAVRLENGVLIWDVQPGDVAKRGYGRLQADILGAGGEVYKSAIAMTVAHESLGAPDAEPPQGVQAWIENAQRTLDAVEDALENLGSAGGGEGGTGGSVGELKIGHGLKLEAGGVLAVDVAHEPEPDNTLPITSSAVHTTLGNIGALLGTI